MGTGRRKQRIGTVVSDKMQKSIVVAVEWAIRHPLYNKPIRRVTKFMAHDEENTAKIGDTVRIEETRPLAADKRWRLIEVVKRGEYIEVPTGEPESGAVVESAR